MLLPFLIILQRFGTNDPSLNRNVGKYHLPHIWDEVLFDIPELKIT